MTSAVNSICFPELFIVNGAVQPKDFPDFKLTALFASEATKSRLVAQDMQYAYLSLHTTNVKERFAKVGLGLPGLIAMGHNVHIGALSFPEAYIFLNSITEFFDKDVKLNWTATPTFVRGDYVAFICGMKTLDEAEKLGPAAVRTVANAIRLYHGIASVGPSIWTGIHGLQENSCVIHSNKHFVFSEGFGEGKDLSEAFQYGLDMDISNLSLSPDAEILMDRAINERTAETRFLFLWICLESIVGDGESRKRLYKRELKSDLINREVFRLFNLRNKMSHEGVFEASIYDCVSVMWAIRLALFASSKNINKMVGGYENWIKSRG